MNEMVSFIIFIVFFIFVLFVDYLMERKIIYNYVKIFKYKRLWVIIYDNLRRFMYVIYIWY